MDDHLKQDIKNVRSVYPDKSLVVYDLSTGIDFSRPRDTAEALAEVFFEMDASNWFKEDGGDLKFKAVNSVEIRIADEHNRKIEKTVEKFKKDLSDDEIRNAYSREIKAAATYAPGLGMYLLFGVTSSLINRAVVRKDQMNEYLEKILEDILGNVKFVTR